MEALKAFAASQGGTLDLSSFGIDNLDAGIRRETKSFNERELDALYMAATRPRSMITKTCANCKEPFKTDWNGVGCCSVLCYVSWFEKTAGIKPNLAERPMYRFQRPLVISASSLSQIREWAKAVLEDTQSDYESSLGLDGSEPSETQEPPQSPDSPLPELDDDFLTSLGL